MAMKRRAFCRRRARKMSAWTFFRCRKVTTCRVGALVSAAAIAKSFTLWRASRAISITASFSPFKSPRFRPSTVPRIASRKSARFIRSGAIRSSTASTAPAKKMGSVEFSKYLLQEAQVAVSPGIGFGQYGDEHVRFALIENEHRTKQAVRKIKRALGKLLD